jgi:hypothetical protein
MLSEGSDHAADVGDTVNFKQCAMLYHAMRCASLWESNRSTMYDMYRYVLEYTLVS